MKVAIIGTGNVGSAIGGTLARAGPRCRVRRSRPGRGPRTSRRTPARRRRIPGGRSHGRGRGDLAVPWGAVDDVTNEIRDASDDTVVVDVTNPLTSDYSGLATSGGPSAAETVAQRLPRAHVVKAQYAVGSVQADPTRSGRRSTRSTPRTTRSPATIAELLSSIGFAR